MNSFTLVILCQYYQMQKKLEVFTLDSVSSFYKKLDKINLSSIEEKSLKLQKLCFDKSIKIVTFIDPNYPIALSFFEKEYPFIFYKGSLDLLKTKKRVCIVGSRKPFSEVIYWIESQLDSLDFNLVILSGGAQGVDQLVHKSCCLNQIKSVAVLPCSLLDIYPTSFERYISLLSETKGCVLSPIFIEEKLKKYHFYYRNKLLALLSTDVLLLQAGYKSGTMVTAHYALDYAKNIFVLPQFPNSNTIGGLNLIKEGAQLITNFEEILC
jgi:DNA processing protein